MLSLAERIRCEIESKPILKDDNSIQITTSIGAAVMTDNDETIDALIGRSDAALYRAKDLGRNQVFLSKP